MLLCYCSGVGTYKILGGQTRHICLLTTNSHHLLDWICLTQISKQVIIGWPPPKILGGPSLPSPPCSYSYVLPLEYYLQYTLHSYHIAIGCVCLSLCLSVNGQIFKCQKVHMYCIHCVYSPVPNCGIPECIII